ncbi:MAG: flagellin [Planctomycetota bacterium]|nr:flagellin [Planctomycetota bacterium]MDG1984791.1 flagellin [Planctomycetota bacterium]
MGLRVNTNIASMTAQRNLSVSSGRLQGNFSRLASGLRIATAADDAAGLAISERMRSQIKSFEVAGRNAMDGVSLVQTAEGSLGEVSGILSRMRELSMQSANGTLSASDRATLDNEFDQLKDEVDRIANTTVFNGINLLDGSASTGIPIQVGIGSSVANDVINVTLDSTSTTQLSIDTADLNSIVGAQTALASIDSAIGAINDARGVLGAQQNRMESSIRSIQVQRENLSASESRIRDVDVAMETADLTRNSIMQQAATSILQQANVQPQIALSLLQG